MLCRIGRSRCVGAQRSRRGVGVPTCTRGHHHRASSAHAAAGPLGASSPGAAAVSQCLPTRHHPRASSPHCAILSITPSFVHMRFRIPAAWPLRRHGKLACAVCVAFGVVLLWESLPGNNAQIGDAATAQTWDAEALSLVLTRSVHAAAICGFVIAIAPGASHRLGAAKLLGACPRASPSSHRVGAHST